MTITSGELVEVHVAYRASVSDLYAACMADRQDPERVAVLDAAVTKARRALCRVCQQAVADGWTQSAIAVAVGGKPAAVAKWVT